MIAATVHDPQVIATLAQGSAADRAGLIDHLGHVCHCHVSILDRNGQIGTALIEASRALPDRIRTRLNAALNPSRVIRCPADPECEGALINLGLAPETAAALALTSCGADAVITDQNGKAAQGLSSLPDAGNLFTLPEFLTSDCHQRLMDTMGAISTGGMHRAEFASLVAAPVLRWAKTVTIIDRYIGTALFDHNPDSRERDTQWGRTRETLQFLYDLWTQPPQRPRVAFVIVTQPYRAADWGKHPWHEATHPNAALQAQRLAENLDFGREVEVRLIQVPCNLAGINHDRYLITNQGITLNFSRGFDLIRPNGELIQSAVSLHQDWGRPSPVSALLGAPQLARAVLTPDGWRGLTA